MADDCPAPANPAAPVHHTGTGAIGHTRAEWRRRILRELGGNGVDPELSEEQLDGALQSALELWNRHRPCRQWFPFDIPAAETVVITFFADEAHTQVASDAYIRRVVRVDFADADRRILGPRAGFLEGYYLRWGFEGPRLFFQLHVAQRTYERLTGSRPAWYWNPADRRLYVSSPSRDTRIMVFATREMKLEEIPYDQVSEFSKAATAKAKYYLARTLGSKGAIKGAGGEIQTDAAELRQESKDEWNEVVTKLEVSQMSIPPPDWAG